MNIKYTLLVVLATATIAWSSCSDSDDPPQKQDTSTDVCDDLSYVTYNANVKAIVDANCANPYCHGSNAGGFNLNTYAEVKAVAQQDRFLKAIKHEAGAVSMPKDQAKMGEGEISIIECWIVNGFKEN